ncbi:ATP synthase F1 subunit epsilon [Acidiphilium sp.]|uniref:ATP synthase F1 subunit epsilon n=1 Tax=Acidiphilium sp. TaxID=527 RepID=UPI0025888679|nr:ATP synthase F1 subunit epsilon [Acidiphilium sp.]
MSIALEIISTEKLLLSRDVDMVVIPGTEGDIGVLPGHAKLITGLRGGLVDIYESGKISARYFVSAGFAEVTESRCAVLADAIVLQEELDEATAQAALAEAKAAYDAVDIHDTDAYREASDKLISAQAMVDSVTPHQA